MADLILLPTLERLHPYNAFGLTFSVALDKVEGQRLADLGDLKGLCRSFLQPWSWKSDGDSFLDIQQVMFFSLDGTKRVEPFPFTQRTDGLKKPQRLALERALEDRFGLFEALDTKDFSPWTRTSRVSRVSRSQRPWPAFLAQVSLYPYPMPQDLLLSLFLDFAKDLGPQVVAAPVLRLQRSGAAIDLIPSLEEGSQNPVVLEYTSPDPAITIRAQTMPCDAGTPVKTDYFDFGSLWIKTGAVAVTSTDWRAGLELRLAEQLHIPRTLVEWLKETKKKGVSPALASSYPKVAWLVLQQLRSVLGPGLRKGPEGRFLQRAGGFLKVDLPSDLEGFVKTAETWFQNSGDRPWMGWLRQAVTGAPPAEGATGTRLLDAAFSASPEEAIGRLLTFDQTVAELDQLLASVAAPETVRRLFKLQWKAYVEAHFKTPGPTREEALARGLAGDLPENIDLQRLLLLDHLGLHWDDLRKAFAGSPSLQTARDQLDKIYRGILETLIKDVQKTPKGPIWQSGDLVALADRFADRVLPAKPETLDALEPMAGTRGLTFQLDTLAQDPEGSDALQHMQGVAMLMRRKGDSDPAWHCLSLAAARIGSTTIDPILIPSRLAYVNDLRSCTVTYDNAPLTVAGPMGHAEVAGAELGDPTEKRQAIDEPLLDLVASSHGKIPALVFGETYEIRPFLVTNSGAIPQLISNGGNPWELKAKVQSLDGLTIKPIARPYDREVPVGAIRLLSKEASGLPPIPANVAPRIRELAPELVLPKYDPLLTGKPDAGSSGLPLLLLAPKLRARPGVDLRSEFSFDLLPPTVDLRTWDRWVAREVPKNRRKLVWRSFHKLAYDQETRKSKLESAGVYLDDPAVAGIWVELVRIEEDGTQTSLGSLSFPLQDKSDPQVKPDFSNWKDKDLYTLKTEQHESLPVSCSCKDGPLKVTVGTQGQSLSAPAGRLFRLSFYAFLKPGAEGRFKGKKEYVQREDKKEGTSPWHLLIEIPQELARSAQLQTSLREALSREFADGKIKVGLDLKDPRLKDLSGHIYRAELLHQAWSWRGRPPAPQPAPYPANLDADPRRLSFEMSEFGERADDEHRRLPMPRAASSGGSQPFFQYEESLVGQGAQGDPRALYHRFSVRVVSRWEGILPEEESFLDARDETTQVLWKSLFVPCRFTGDVPVPKVKLVLPLTQGETGTTDDGPGLLVVTDGGWYEVGGLAEELGVEVMEVTGPDRVSHFLQAGTDPIVTGQSAGDLLGEPEGALRTPAYRIEFTPSGAIGHHRDSSQVAPHFLASSFLLPRPSVWHQESAGNDKSLPVDLSWWFLKLRFRRELRLPGGKSQSDWSAPLWVQILPGVERVEGDWFGSGDLKVLLDTNGQFTVEGRAAPAPHGNFHLFGVVTRKVIDFAGRPDQEVYLGVWRPSGGSWITDVKAPEPGEDLCIRWIEVQSPRLPAIGTGDDLWKAIFDSRQADIERARIVRISKRFDIKGKGR